MTPPAPVPPQRPAVRRVRCAVALPAAVSGVLVAHVWLPAAPAHAMPEGFSPDAEPVDLLPSVLLLGGIPLLLFVGIVLAVYLPAMVRGERVAPGAAPLNDQWLGGPRQGTLQLAGPDGDESQAGGAHGRW